ncbi:hypothetical protein [Microvirga sp. P5_D2]
MKIRLSELEGEKAALVSRMNTASNMPNISVHPNLAAVYRKKVEELEQLMEDAQHRDEAMELIRSLIEKIELSPREGGGVEAILHGDLARILALCSAGSEDIKPLRAICVGLSERQKSPRPVFTAGALVLVAGN